MEKKQCSIDWLIDQIKNVENQKNLTGAQWMDVVEQAKEMHKEEIIVAFYEGIEQESNEHGTMYLDKTEAVKYYNETFGGDNE